MKIRFAEKSDIEILSTYDKPSKAGILRGPAYALLTSFVLRGSAFAPPQKRPACKVFS